MSTETNVYVSALQDSLQKKQQVLQTILDMTKEQREVLAQEHPAMDRFEEIMDAKEEQIARLNELDGGFESLFKKIGDTLQKQRYQYEKQIKQMQEYIRSITDLGVQIESMEHQNRDAFQKYLVSERKEIRTGRASSKTAVSYYQNMPNQHHEWQTYFMDQKQ
ncbi:MAG: flagellar export chaperone FlgN [Eubacteriales bacterium]|nr:flagellar export chaperone FlgN [Eubacteriales bacterium]